MRGFFCLAGILTLSAAGQAPQAQPGRAHKVELSIPFGVVPGTLVTSGDHLIFIDEQQPGDSFAVYRPEIADIRVEEGTLRVQTRRPVRDRSGERSQFNIRLVDPAGAEPVVTWSRVPTQTVAASGNAPRTDERSANATTFDVRHNHTFGGCTGRLIVSADRLVYESVSELNDSRQWSMSDIRELNRNSPYHLEIKPFSGNSYTFEFSGQPMDNQVYSQLVDRIAAARSTRP
jgi:hypothetical protein